MSGRELLYGLALLVFLLALANRMRQRPSSGAAAGGPFVAGTGSPPNSPASSIPAMTIYGRG